MSANRLLNPSLFFLLVFFLEVPFLHAADQKSQDSKKVATQNIGGLLFEVDEGVKIEQGAGGSVYMKSNKEFMQEKFSLIDQKFSDLESRIAKLEAKNASPSPGSSPAPDPENRRVLIT